MKYTLSKGLNNSPDARAIRQSVFVEEQGFEYEFDDIDEIALHLVLYDENDNPCATGRLFFDGCMKIGRYRRYEMNTEVSRSAVKLLPYLKKKHLNRVHIISSFPLKYRQKIFIKNLDYTEIGEIYKEEFCPHIKMFKDLK